MMRIVDNHYPGLVKRSYIINGKSLLSTGRLTPGAPAQCSLSKSLVSTGTLTPGQPAQCSLSKSLLSTGTLTPAGPVFPQ